MPRSKQIEVMPFGNVEAPGFVNSRFSVSHWAGSVVVYVPARL
jgi:hypothetical protein